jgi:hypothetical protein
MRKRIVKAPTLEARSSAYKAGHTVLQHVNETKSEKALRELEAMFN